MEVTHAQQPVDKKLEGWQTDYSQELKACETEHHEVHQTRKLKWYGESKTFPFVVTVYRYNYHSVQFVKILSQFLCFLPHVK